MKVLRLCSNKKKKNSGNSCMLKKCLKFKCQFTIFNKWLKSETFKNRI